MGEPDPSACMLSACFEGDRDAVRALLAADAGLARVRDSELESTPLHIAGHRGFVGIVEALLAAGAEVDAREGCSGATALHWAAEGGQVEVARRLCDAGASLQARDDWHALAPLDWALFVVHAPHLHHDRAGVARLLEELGAGASIFGALASGRDDEVRAAVARDPGRLGARLGPVDGEATPLDFAVERRAAGQVRLLLELGADPAAVCARGLSPRARAWLDKDDAILELLAARDAPDDLSTLVVERRHDEAARLLSRSPQLVQPGGRHAGLLHTLVLLGLADETEFLLRQGADPNARLPALGLDEWLSELPPLFLAASKGRETCARHLLEHGADPNARGMRSVVTPLHAAAFRGHRPLVTLLLERGADPRLRDQRQGSTPAGWARQAGHAELAELLARSDADHS